VADPACPCLYTSKWSGKLRKKVERTRIPRVALTI
jgi:hypothetical protein